MNGRHKYDVTVAEWRDTLLLRLALVDGRFVDHGTGSVGLAVDPDAREAVCTFLRPDVVGLAWPPTTLRYNVAGIPITE